MREHRKNYIFRDINSFVKMSVSYFVRTLPSYYLFRGPKLGVKKKLNFQYKSFRPFKGRRNFAHAIQSYENDSSVGVFKQKSTKCDISNKIV